MVVASCALIRPDRSCSLQLLSGRIHWKVERLLLFQPMIKPRGFDFIQFIQDLTYTSFVQHLHLN